MTRFIEYDVTSGRIICEVFAEAAPTVSAGHAVLEVDENLIFDTNNSAVKDGVIVRLYETPEERRERERLRREHRERARRRVRGLVHEFVISLLEQDDDRIVQLREEYAALRNYL